MGYAYLSKEINRKKLYLAFKSKSRNSKVLILSREPPLNLRGFFKGADFKCLWLTNISVDHEHVRPQDLEQLSYTIERFIEKNKKSAVLITGVEFIISYTSFEQTIHLIQAIKDIALIHDCLLIVNIGIGTLEEREEHLFEQELEIVRIK